MVKTSVCFEFQGTRFWEGERAFRRTVGHDCRVRRTATSEASCAHRTVCSGVLTALPATSTMPLTRASYRIGKGEMESEFSATASWAPSRTSQKAQPHTRTNMSSNVLRMLSQVGHNARMSTLRNQDPS